MSDENPDTCMLQLNVAKQAISDYETKYKKMQDENAEKEADYNEAKNDYNAKVALYNTALATFNNYKSSSDSGWQQCGNTGGILDWENDSCSNCCEGKQSLFPNYAGQAGGAIIQNDVTSNGWTYRACQCRYPDPNTYANNGI